MMRLHPIDLKTSLKRNSGFTLVETIIVLAIIGILTVAVVTGSGSQIKNERFSGEVKVFADNLRQAQTHSYTVQTGTPGSCGATVCFWRGNLMTMTPQDASDGSYALDLLYGDDYSKYTTASGQTMGVRGTQPIQSYHLNGVHLKGIAITGQPSIANGTPVWLAFLAPDGKGYVCAGVGAICDPAVNGLNNYSPGIVTFTLSDTATKLISHVTYDPSTGSITITS